MIRLTRPPLPGELADNLQRATDGLKSLSRKEQGARARTLWRSRSTLRQAVGARLREFAPGRERCMYCGDNQGTDIDHFSPVALTPLLTFAWENHLLACSVCNSHHKRDQFPRDDRGRPLLLDPTRDDPFEHLALSLTLGRYLPLTERGEVTERVCGLNRDILTRGRQNARTTLGFLIGSWQSARSVADTSTMEQVVRTVHEQPFADVVQAMLRYSTRPGAAEVFADLPPGVLRVLLDEEFRARLALAR
ncbi:HNH endonuclease [Actinokineospora sp. NBRC 105648]|uniref:HNH endonuclease n=1 Tax=Actinokineospora sp. NBRC 105648 TaxID=3032206 RepID=UPI0024A0530B|nr:HNH endonuclease [Actinokineospora sp. NBRC 105648]GLZ43140.1 HNH endonuclease [Actinokineospora sp. NBRC 105648]